MKPIKTLQNSLTINGLIVLLPFIDKINKFKLNYSACPHMCAGSNSFKIILKPLQLCIFEKIIIVLLTKLWN